MSPAPDPIEENPYVAPGEGVDESAPTPVYTLNVHAVSRKELRAMAGGGVPFAILSLWRAFRLPVSVPAGLPEFDRLILIDRRDIPRDSLDAIRQAEEACEEAGMIFRFLFQSPVIGPGGQDYAAVYLSEDGKSSAIAVARRTRGGSAPGRAFGAIAVLSRLEGDRWLITANGPGTVDLPPGNEVVRNRSWTPSQVLGEHRRRIDEEAGPVIPIEAPELVALQIRREREIMRYQIDRGVFVPMTEGQLRTLLRRAESDQGFPPEHHTVTWLRGLEAIVYVAVLVMLVLTLTDLPQTPGEAAQRLSTIGFWVVLALVLSLARWFGSRSLGS